jgi:hypothetical protein
MRLRVEIVHSAASFPPAQLSARQIEREKFHRAEAPISLASMMNPFSTTPTPIMFDSMAP